MYNVKWVPFVNTKWTKGYFFCQKWYIKGKGLNLGADPPCIKIYQVTPHQNSPPPPPTQPPLGKPDKKSRKKLIRPLHIPFYILFAPPNFA